MSLKESMGDLFQFASGVAVAVPNAWDHTIVTKRRDEAVRLVDANTCQDCDGNSGEVSECPGCSGAGTLPELQEAIAVSAALLALVGTEQPNRERTVDGLARKLAKLVAGEGAHS